MSPRILVSIDVESDGLHGAGFAFAGVALDLDTDHVDASFLGRAPDPDPCDPWVARHVLPALAAVPVDHATPRALRDAAWAWLRRWPRDAVWADCGWPVEARFLAACVDDDPGRGFDGPYPLHEVGTLLALAYPRAEDVPRAADLFRSDAVLTPHHPLFDAEVSARQAAAALRRLGRI